MIRDKPKAGIISPSILLLPPCSQPVIASPRLPSYSRINPPLLPSSSTDPSLQMIRSCPLFLIVFLHHILFQYNWQNTSIKFCCLQLLKCEKMTYVLEQERNVQTCINIKKNMKMWKVWHKWVCFHSGKSHLQEPAPVSQVNYDLELHMFHNWTSASVSPRWDWLEY